MTAATSGLPSSAQFAYFDPDTSCWKTCRVTALWGSDEFSGTWPPHGTWDLGSACERVMPERPTDASGCSSSLPTPTASDGNGCGPHGTGGSDLRTAVAELTLMPTPVTQPQTGNGHARNLGKEAQLLPTPSVNDLATSNREHTKFQSLTRTVAHETDWGKYAPAIARWEAVIEREAPPPTESGRSGMRLSPRFVEWMQGLPEGWVCDVPGLSRNQQLELLGNGVVPQQAVLAMSLLIEADSRADAG